MSIEAMFWIGMILASPGIYMVSKMLFDYILDTFFSDDVLEISVELEDGTVKTKVVHLDKTDELVPLLEAIRSKRSLDRKGAI